MNQNDSILIELKDTINSISYFLEDYLRILERIEYNVRLQTQDHPEVIQNIKINEEYKKVFLSIGYRFDSDYSNGIGKQYNEIEDINEKIRTLYTLLKIGRKI